MPKLDQMRESGQGLPAHSGQKEKKKRMKGAHDFVFGIFFNKYEYYQVFIYLLKNSLLV
jgi:hypothetical protein